MFLKIGVAGANALADLLRRDKLPALTTLCLDTNNGIQDEGVVALAKALEEAPRTLLVVLAMHEVGMGNLGMFALASLIHRGRMQQVESLEISGAPDEGMIALAQAIDTRGLPNLQKLYIEGSQVSAIGFDAFTCVCQMLPATEEDSRRVSYGLCYLPERFDSRLASGSRTDSARVCKGAIEWKDFEGERRKR